MFLGNIGESSFIKVKIISLKNLAGAIHPNSRRGDVASMFLCTICLGMKVIYLEVEIITTVILHFFFHMTAEVIPSGARFTSCSSGIWSAQQNRSVDKKRTPPTHHPPNLRYTFKSCVYPNFLDQPEFFYPFTLVFSPKILTFSKQSNMVISIIRGRKKQAKKHLPYNYWISASLFTYLFLQ